MDVKLLSEGGVAPLPNAHFVAFENEDVGGVDFVVEDSVLNFFENEAYLTDEMLQLEAVVGEQIFAEVRGFYLEFGSAVIQCRMDSLS